jgi:hypothetical protein
LPFFDEHERIEPRKSAGFARFAQDEATNLHFFGRKTGSDSPMLPSSLVSGSLIPRDSYLLQRDDSSLY